MKPQSILLLSILAGLLAVVLVQVQLREERGETVVLFRATETVPAGQALGSRLETVTLPGDKLFPNLLEEAPTAEMSEYVSSTALGETVRAGQIILYRHLDSMASGGLRDQIPRGLKAISIEVDSASAVAFLIEPGDLVDVLVALPQPAKSPAGLDLSSFSSFGSPEPSAELERLQGLFSADAEVAASRILRALTNPEQGEELETRVLLEGAEVLAVGRRFRRAERHEVGARYDTVTLLVSEEQATKIAHGRTVSNRPMTLVLRSPEDDVEGSSNESGRADG